VSSRSGAQTVVRDLGPSLKGRASISVPVGGTALSESPTNERRGTVSQGGTCRIVPGSPVKGNSPSPHRSGIPLIKKDLCPPADSESRKWDDIRLVSNISRPERYMS
jgi:hypothetical protein